MKVRNQYNFLIIGQGLAGSLLAWRLIHAGQKVRVLDDNHHSSSSMVAAGLINPMPGMRFNCSAQVFHWLESVQQTYGELEGRFAQQFLHWINMVRLFRSAEQQRFYQRQADKPETASLLGRRFEATQSGQPIAAPWGGFVQHQTGFVKLPALLTRMRHWLQQQQAYTEARVDYAQLQVNSKGVRYQDFSADQLIFCDGFRSKDNPWFDFLPFSPDKGEILTLSSESATAMPDHIINGAHWLLPLPDGRCRFGSTHEHQRLDGQPTAEARSALQNGMVQLLLEPQQMRIEAHLAGVRPATADRMPFLGTHPEQHRLHMFNGFGAHGSLTIPWYSKQMCNWLLHGKELPAAANIQRLR